jgi:hypothetical protein
MLKSISSLIVLAALMTPALADEFWVVQGPNETCSVVEKKSDGTVIDMATGAVANTPKIIGSAFPTRAGAEGAIGHMRKCGSAE